LDKISQNIEQLEKALAESEERLSILANLSYDVLWERDIVGGYHKWIGDIDSCLGYERNEFPRTIKAWENTIHPDDRGVTSWSEDGVPLVITGVILDITEKLLHENKIFELEKKVALTKKIKNLSLILFTLLGATKVKV
jgi:PAS domain-containing protein